METSLLTKSDVLKMVQENEIKPQTAFKLLNSLSITSKEDEAIAVIGISGQFPEADNAHEFWKNLVDAKDCVVEIPEERWKLEGFYNPDPSVPNMSTSKWGGFLKGYDQFDPLFFHISPKEAEYMEPQQRLFLMEAWRALEDAGYTKESLNNKKCGVFVGYGGGDYTSVIREAGCDVDAYQFMGNSGSILASRIAYYLNLKGPAVSMDTACSSSLVSVHLAMESIRDKSSEIAIAGGVMVFATKDYYLMSSKTNMLAIKGRCRTFDMDADGFTPGEAAAAIVLKPYKKAIKDHDHIYGIILGSGVNQDGKTNGITAPSSSSQQSLINEVYDKYHIDPETIGYVEAHGTGTALGDPIEIFALSDAYRKYTMKKQFCPIGSVKSNIGHTLVASGACSIIKTLLCIKNHTLVPSLHYHNSNPTIDFENSPFYVNTKVMQWKTEGNSPRRAAISAFGFSGTNCHLVLEEHIDHTEYQHRDGCYLYPISAHSKESLRRMCEKYIDYIHSNKDNFDCGNFAYSLSCTRQQHKVRIAILAEKADKLLKALQDILEERENDRVLTVPLKHPVQEEYSLAELYDILKDEKLPEDEKKSFLAQLGKSYVSGENIIWDELYGKGKYRKLFLPVYEFSTNRFWIQQQSKTVGGSKTAEGNSMAVMKEQHPIMIENMSDHSGKKFLIQCNKTDFYIKDHIVQGKCVLPGVVFLEAAYYGGLQVCSDIFCIIKNMTWLKPVTVLSEEKLIVHYISRDNGMQAEFYEYKNHCIGDRLAKCDIVFGTPNAGREQFDINSLITNLNVISREECYKAFQKVGFAYGESFQVIQKIYYNEEYAIAHLKLSNVLDSHNPAFTLNPAIMDGALQTVIAFMSHLNPDIQSSYVPFLLKKLEVYSKLPEECYVYAKVSESRNDDQNKKFNLRICDLSGNTLVNMEDFYARALNQPTYGVAYYEQKWTLQRLTAESNHKKVLAFCDDIKQACSSICDINVHGYEDYNLLTDGTESKENVIIFCSKKMEENYSFPLGLFQLLKHILAFGIKKKLQRIMLVYETSENSMAYCALEGLIRALQLEYPNISFKLLAMEKLETESDYRLLNQELQEKQSSPSVKYINGERFIHELGQIKPTCDYEFAIQQNGTYLITGGFGKIGYQTALYIAKKKGNLLIVGRRNEEKINTMLHELRKYEIQVTYMQGDISDSDFTHQAIEQARQFPGKLKGIIHTAGIINDKRFIEKEFDDFMATCKVKIDGIHNLDEATKDKKLDFFIAYTAMAGILGNEGQSDYSYANAYVDYFISERAVKCERNKRFGKSISIAWPYWKDGGMQLSKTMQNQLSLKFGMQPLPNDIAIKTLDNILQSKLKNVVIFYGNKDVISKENKVLKEELLITTDGTKEKVSGVVMNSNLIEDGSVENFIKDEISRILKVPMDYINNENDFGSFGFDSLTYMELADSINAKYGLELTPATFFEYHTLDTMLAYLKEYHSERFIKSAARQINVVQKMQIPVTETTKSGKDIPVAIIGIAGIMPNCENLDEFWEALVKGADLVDEIPIDRWDWRQYFGDPSNEVNKTNSKWGAFMNHVDCFDAEFFGIAPKEAQVMDPQQRLFLQIVWHAIEDAGYNAENLSGEKIGLFVGTSTSDYQELLRENQVNIEAYSALGITHSVIANRISYIMNWSGESEPIDTACSSSLVAVHRAVSVIQNGECEMAVAGGINCILSPSIYISFGKAGMLSPDGRCKTFDKDANGYVRGEGGGALLLKPLDKAIKDHDHIYAVIKGSAVNHGGKTNSLTSPNPKAQAEVIYDAISKAKIDPLSISYLEAHGTGTNLGDPIEINGIKNAFTRFYPNTDNRKKSCGIGSVKSNLGHLEAAAGMASLLKVVLAMKHNIIPPTIHYHTLNPYINLEHSPFYIVNEAKNWDETIEESYPKRAGISGFGFSGVNAHVILEEYPVPKAEQEHRESFIFVLSALNPERLKEYATLFLNFINRNKDTVCPNELAYTLQTGRKNFNYRLAILFNNLDSLEQRLERFIHRDNDKHVFFNDAKLKNEILDTLFMDDLGKDYINKLCEYNRTESIAKLWVSGGNIDWSSLYKTEKPYKIPLPGYPFEKKRYWMKKENKVVIEKSVRKRSIIGRHISVSPLEHVFPINLTEHEWYVEEHQVSGKRVVPGTVILEMVTEAVSVIEAVGVITLQEVYWLRPIIVDGSLQIDLRITKKGSEYSYAITGSDQSTETIYAKGVAFVEKEFYSKAISLDKIKSRCNKQLDAKQHYWVTEQLGILFGSCFRSIHSINSNENEALVRFDANVEDNQKGYELPFLSIDGAFQGISGLIMEGMEGPLLPYYVGSLTCKMNQRSVTYGYVTKQGNNQFNIELTDAEGNVLCVINTAVVGIAKENHRRDTFTPVWERYPLEELKSEGNYSNQLCVIIYSGHQLETLELVKQLKVVYGINTVAYAIEDLINSSESIQRVGLADRIYYLASIENEDNYFNKIHQFELEDSSLMKLYRLIKLLDNNQGFDHKVQLTVVTNNLHQITDEMIVAEGGGIFGFLHSAAKEFENLYVSCLDLDLSEIHTDLVTTVQLLCTIPCSKELQEVCIRERKAYFKKFYPIVMNKRKGGFKNHGVYVILGGRGGIGTVLTDYLLKEYQASIILIGRSNELSEAEMLHFQKTSEKGGNITYLSADGGNDQQMKNAVAAIEEKFGPVNGVIHSAIVLKDKLITNMSEEDMKNVLWPKVNGSIGLYKAFAGKQLDFFLYFSSVQSMIGMIGQSNYSAACTFEENLARYIASVENWNTRVINWGYWGSTGIVSGKEYQQRMKRAGIYSIEPEEGIACIEQCLANPVKQVIMMKCDKSIYEKIGIDDSKEYIISAKTSGFEKISLGAEIKVSDIIEDTCGYEKISNYAGRKLLKVFHQAGLFQYYNEVNSIDFIKRKLGLIPKYNKLFDELLCITERNGFIERAENSITTRNEALNELNELEEEGRRLMDCHPETEAYITLIDACMEQYLAVLRGEITATEVMFPNSNVNLVGNVYRGNKISDFYNQVLANWVGSFVASRWKENPNEQIRILEIGAGTGGTSAYVLKAVNKYANCLQYDYTDVAESFIHYGKMTYGKEYPFVNFKVVDIEQETRDDEGRYDLVIGTNVLHVSSNIIKNVSNIKKKIKREGALIFCEMVTKEDYITLTFGLLDGWWLFDDDENRIQGTPLFTQENWKKILLKTGYHSFDSFNQGECKLLPQDVMVAYSDGICGFNLSPNIYDKEHTQTDDKNSRPSISEEGCSIQTISENKSMDDMMNYVENVIRESIMKDLEIEYDRIDVNKPFRDYGIDSITGVNVINSLNQLLKIDMKTIVLFDYSTISELTNYIILEYGSKIELVRSKESDTLMSHNIVNDVEGKDIKDILHQLETGEISVDKASQMLGD